MMVSRRVVMGSALVLAAVPALAAPVGLAAAVASSRRSVVNVRRDRYRHPLALLEFFGVTAAWDVLEIEPGAGYWTEILAPYVRAKGHYTAAIPSDTPEAQKEQAYFLKKLGGDPRDYSQVSVIPLTVGQALGDAASYDFVLSCRNLHNWLAAGTAPVVLGAIFAALKPGGIFGIEDHRASTDVPQDPKAKSGYVRQDYAQKLIETAGFQFVESSEIGANPKDTKNYPDGVWDLLPTLKQGAVNQSKYLAIGESDRWTLKFVKP